MENSDNVKQVSIDERRPNRLGEKIWLQMEILLWIFIGFVISGRFWMDTFQYLGDVSIAEILSKRYFDVLFGLLAVAFPIIFQLIFSSLPLQSIRTKRIGRRFVLSSKPEANEGKYKSDDRNEFENIRFANIDENISIERLLASYSYESDKLAKNIYSRSGVYLLVGVLVAFSGLIFFYLQTTVIKGELGLSELIAALGPRFGILFFIEFIAFFFLKQYRSAMDEFRYYEAIKRNREENFALIKYANEKKSDLDIFKLVSESKFYSGAGRLSKGETTEIIESKKLDKDELAVFEKIIDALALKKGK